MGRQMVACHRTSAESSEGMSSAGFGLRCARYAGDKMRKPGRTNLHPGSTPSHEDGMRPHATCGGKFETSSSGT